MPQTDDGARVEVDKTSTIIARRGLGIGGDSVGAGAVVPICPRTISEMVLLGSVAVDTTFYNN